MTPNLHLLVISLFPLAGAPLNGLLGERFSPQAGGAGGAGFLFAAFSPEAVVSVALAFSFAAFAMALWISARFSTLTLPYQQTLAPWLKSGGFTVDFSFALDQLSLVMLLVVSGVGFLIHIYSVGYMWEES